MSQPNCTVSKQAQELKQQSIPELFAQLTETQPTSCKQAALNELHRRGYSDEDIKITLQ